MPVQYKDYYKSLGVARNASEADIKKRRNLRKERDAKLAEIQVALAQTGAVDLVAHLAPLPFAGKLEALESHLKELAKANTPPANAGGSLAGNALDWPQWRGPNRDGVSTETGLLSDWSDEGLKELSKFTRLTSLNVREAEVTVEGLKKFREALPNCRTVP